MKYRLTKEQWEPGQIMRVPFWEQMRNTRQRTTGTQTKFRKGDLWYKCDDYCREALCETLVSDIIRKSNLSKYVDTLEYEPLLIQIGKERKPACVSPNFVGKGNRIVTYEKALDWFDLSDSSDNSSSFIDMLQRLSKIQDNDLLQYMCCIAELDTLTLNEDRHTNNIAFIRRKDGSVIPAPIFDNGRCFAMNEHNDKLSVKEAIEKTNPRIAEFSSFQSAADTMERLVGCAGIGLFRTRYSERDLEKTLAKFDGIYEPEILDRAKTAVLMQMERAERYVLSASRTQKNEELKREIVSHYGDRFQMEEKNGDLFLSSIETGTLLISLDAHVNPVENGQTISLDDYLQKNPKGFAVAAELNQLLIDEKEKVPEQPVRKILQSAESRAVSHGCTRTEEQER